MSSHIKWICNKDELREKIVFLFEKATRSPEIAALKMQTSQLAGLKVNII